MQSPATENEQQRRDLCARVFLEPKRFDFAARLIDAVLLKSADYFEVVQKALAQCAQLQDRFCILDVPDGNVRVFRNGVGTDYLSYAAAYHPYLRTSLNYVYDEKAIQVKVMAAMGRTRCQARSGRLPSWPTVYMPPAGNMGPPVKGFFKVR